jgi:hypothetical protein
VSEVRGLDERGGARGVERVHHRARVDQQLHQVGVALVGRGRDWGNAFLARQVRIGALGSGGKK